MPLITRLLVLSFTGSDGSCIRDYGLVGKNPVLNAVSLKISVKVGGKAVLVGKIREERVALKNLDRLSLILKIP